MRVLFFGDLMGKPGRKLMAGELPFIRSEWGPFDFIIANCENSAGGFGITEKVMEELFANGADCLTSGNHIWDKKESVPLLDEEKRLLRPANYPPGCRGQGVYVLERRGKKMAVMNLQGRVYMQPIDCPFRVADGLLETLGVRAVFLDMHAETTSEKKAMGLYLDGRVSAVIGTHTHVQTADEQILPGGTAFVTDAGMTGGHGGVIGMAREGVLPRFLQGTPTKFEICSSGLRVNAVVVDIDDETGRAAKIQRINYSPKKS
ncbi:MAG: TIGR00282 family metallophosphoesterase [Synergistota bacterium]|nr:TIGR00282 family metallophosphoesterase [Synergistota bacterium]